MFIYGRGVGPTGLGAYEQQLDCAGDDTLFCNDFEFDAEPWGGPCRKPAANGVFRCTPDERGTTMHHPVLPTRTAFLAAALLCISGTAGAACLPGAIAKLYVGDTTDTRCNFGNIQDAVAGVVCPDTTIFVTNTQGYSGQAISIQNKSVTIQGYAGACGTWQPPVCDSENGCSAPPRIAIGGDGSHSVFRIGGSSHITLANLDISGGRNMQGRGGGVDFEASGSLTLQNLAVHGNHARHGGGISFYGSGTLALSDMDVTSNSAEYDSTDGNPYRDDANGGGLAVVSNGGHVEATIGSGSVFSNNTAKLGGGINVADDVHLTLIADGIEIHHNNAVSSGGGIGIGGVLSLAATQVDIGSPGNGANAVLHDNIAVVGGGIALDNDARQARLRLFSTDPQRPVTLTDNFAIDHTYYHGNGGGLYVAVYDRGPICLADFRIENNVADSYGGAMTFHGGDVYINTDPNGICGYAMLPAVHCAAGVRCNTIAGNVTYQHEDGHGATVIFGGSTLDAQRFSLTGNVGGNLLSLNGWGGITSSFSIGNCLLAGNSMQNGLVNLYRAALTIEHCTVAGNTFVDDGVFTPTAGSPASDFTLSDSIVHQPGHHVWLDYSQQSAVHPSYLMVNDLVGLPSGTGVVAGNPKFADPGNGNYRLAGDSPAVDFAPAATEGLDLDAHPRNVDLPGTINAHGLGDLGAYERQLACAGDDTLFCDGFDPG